MTATVSQNLRTLSQFAAEHNAFSVGGLRWHIFNAAKNGLAESGALVRVGRRIYVDPERFFSWVSSIQAGQAA